MNTCQTCRWFAALNGQCRSRSPVAILIGVNAQQQAIFAGTWPPTQTENWCREHEEDKAGG